MAATHVFISYAPADAAFARDVSLALESQQIPIWSDTHQRRGGDRLAPEVRWAIEQARHVLVIYAPHTETPAWMRREIEYAREIARRHADTYRVIPIFLPGADTTQHAEGFSAPIHLGVDGLGAAWPALRAALGEPRPAEPYVTHQKNLVLSFRAADPAHRWTVDASLLHDPTHADTHHTTVTLGTFPPPPVESLLHWYWQSYPHWPTETLRQWARQGEMQLIAWGCTLYEATLGVPALSEIITQWCADPAHARRLIIAGDGTSPAVAAMMALPWEWLHDGAQFLVHGTPSFQCQRRFLRDDTAPIAIAPTLIPLRILVMSPRPDTEPTGHPDDRRSALPIRDVLDDFGQLVQGRVLLTPDFSALTRRLQTACAAGRPFTILHLDADLRADADGVILIGCEAAHTGAAPQRCRSADCIPATTFATLLRTQGIRFVALVQPQCHQRAALAARCAALFLSVGIQAVVTVHPDAPRETLRRFWSTCYGELLRGAPIRQAVYEGQQALAHHSERGIGLGGTGIHWWDWPICQVYVGEHDAPLVRRPPIDLWNRMVGQSPQRPLGLLPTLPQTGFVGRVRELHTLQRLLETQPAILLRGYGGVGKTTVAIAIADWTVRCGRYHQVAYLRDTDAHTLRAILEALGRQLLPEGAHWSVEQYPTFWKALDHLRHTLHPQRILIVLDQLERWPFDTDETTDAFWKTLLQDWPTLQLLGVSRVGPPPFGQPWSELLLRHMEDEDAILLMARALITRGEAPPAIDSGDSFAQLQHVIANAGGHPGALLPVAREISVRGVRATEIFLRWLRKQLHEQARDPKWPLYLALELKLRALSPMQREWANVLAFFKSGGANRLALGHALTLDTASLTDFCDHLIAAGLAEDQGYGHLQFDTALSDYLGQQLDAALHPTWQARWLSGMEYLINQVYFHAFQDSVRTRRLLQKELPNLLAFLRGISRHADPERMAKLSSQLEQLLASLGPSTALTEVVAVRERASRSLHHWSHTRFEIEQRRIERLCDDSAWDDALRVGRQLLRRSQEAGTAAYAGAGYDLAHAHFLLGKLLKRSQAAEPAAQEFSEARGQFQALANAGNVSAGRMAAVAEAEAGDCLRDLRRLNDAAAAYETVLARDGHTVSALVATHHLQLGGVRQQQGRYDIAIGLYETARAMFEGLGFIEGTAQAWQQIGIAHKLNGAMEPALAACKKALFLYEERHHVQEVAAVLGEIGHVHQALNQLEDASVAYQRMAELCVQLGDRRGEEISRNRLAYVLIQLRQHDDARKELYLAGECNPPDSNTARHWAIPRGLRDVSQAVESVDLAEYARQQAIQKYLAYRRAGGQNTNPGAKLCAQISLAIQNGHTEKLIERLDQIVQSPNLPPNGQLLIQKLRAILGGSRERALATDPELHYQYAAEIQLLLEKLA